MNIGLVLSGGGMRGAAHIGVIKALEELGISPTHISGSSAGAIVGAFYAYGYEWQDILEFFKSFQLLDYTKYALNKPGFIDAEKFYSKFETYFKEDDFKALKKKLYITATNILSGELEYFSKGQLIKPILASAAFPGVFAPVKIKRSFYIDGGTLNNFPVEVLKKECDFIIGVYVNGYDEVTIGDLKYSHNIVERAFTIKAVQDDMAKFKECDVVIYPKQINNYGMFNKKNIDTILDFGYEYAKETLTTSVTEHLQLRL